MLAESTVVGLSTADSATATAKRLRASIAFVGSLERRAVGPGRNESGKAMGSGEILGPLAERGAFGGSPGRNVSGCGRVPKALLH